MTPAVKQLIKANISHKLHTYLHDSTCRSYDLEVVEKLKIEQSFVFKTLVVEVDHGALIVAIVPVMKQLSLKKLAKHLHVKKATMVDKNKVEKSTGYILGGVSPFGQKNH